MKEYINVRQWLLEKERYEDLISFDKSDEAKERFYNEMNGESIQTPGEPRFKKITITSKIDLTHIDNIDTLKKYVRDLEGILNDKEHIYNDLIDYINFRESNGL